MVSVYLIRASLNDDIVYKIGWTKRHPMDRIREMKTGNAHDLDIIHIFKSEWGTKIEKKLHSRFSDKKISGEWFTLNEEDVLEFKKLCERYHNDIYFIVNQNTYLQDNFKCYRKK